jgi:predicted ATP-grasp superfamily ATP-dependent carboligase
VLGLDCITGLQTARALHRRGVRVTGIAHDPRHFATRTRCVERVLPAPRDDAGLLACLRPLATEDRPVVIPATDAAVLFLARNGAALASSFRLSNAGGRSIERALGKVAFARHAEEHAVPIPLTAAVESLDDLRRATAELRPPFLLKPDVKDERWIQQARTKLFVASDADELERLYARCRTWNDRFVVQEFVEGEDDRMYSYYAFIGEDGQLVAECVGHKLRQWPRRTGSGTLSEHCRDDEIEGCGRALLASLDHRGLATVNMKRDGRTGRLYVIEANLGRPGMGVFVAHAAGIEMIWLAHRSLAGESFSAPPEARFPGARWVCLKRDFAAAWEAWRAGELGALAYLESLRGVRRCAVLDLRDPMPFLHDLFRLPGHLSRRGQQPTID